MKPLAIDLFSGLGGWADGLVAEGYDVIRVDIEDMFAATGTPKPADCLLMLQDVLTIHGKQFKHAHLITSSSPCTEYSYMAMPWSLAKAKAAAIRADETGKALRKLNALFDAQFRIQRECNEARASIGLPPIPMVVENVRGAQPWVGRAAWNYGSYYLWGDVPALMPRAIDARKVPGFRFDGSGGSFQTASVDRHVAPTEGFKSKGMNWSNRELRGQDFTRIAGAQAEVAEGRKGVGAGAEWFDENLCKLSSKSPARKAASAKIAKIPFALSTHIARVYHPQRIAA